MPSTAGGSGGSRPAHLTPRLVCLVGLGGALGTGGRYALLEAHPVSGGWPVATFTENLLGAFLLGMLLESLLRQGVETPAGRRLRLALGTGLLGGFTTFSSLAIEVERLVAAGDVLLGAAYGVSSVVLGVALCFVGVRVGAGRPVPPGPPAGPGLPGPTGRAVAGAPPIGTEEAPR